MGQRDFFLKTALALRFGRRDQVLLQDAVEAPQNGRAKSHSPKLEASDMPVKEADEPGFRLWHQLDSSFRTPRTAAYCLFATPASYSSPRAAAATHLLLCLLQDSLNETTYLADVAGLELAVGGLCQAFVLCTGV